MAYGPADAIDLAALRRALVIQLRHHGDVLLTSPVFTVLRNHAPGIEVDALVYAETRDMVDLHPAIAQVHVVDRRWKERSALARLAHEWRLHSALRARGYDLLVHLSEHPRGALLARSLGARYAVAHNFARTANLWKKSFTHLAPLAASGRRHRAELNLDVLRRIGIQPGDEERKLVLVPGPEAERHVDRVLASEGLAAKGFVHFQPTSRWRFKCWPTERAGALIDALAGRGEHVVLTAAPNADETAMIAAIRERTNARITDLSGKASLTLKQLSSLTARAKLFIGVDSAPMHIAAAMQTPTIALFGPSSEIEWGPWKVPHRVVASSEHTCRPCGNDGCGGGKVSECLSLLPLERVLAAVDSLLPR